MGVRWFNKYVLKITQIAGFQYPYGCEVVLDSDGNSLGWLPDSFNTRMGVRWFSVNKTWLVR